MRNYSNSKSFNMVAIKNMEENEERNEPVNCLQPEYANIKSIHNKRKESR
jgi:hypothetical protein